MANGLDPQRAEILVPFDLKADVIRPIEQMQVDIRDIKNDFRLHVDTHNADKAAEAAARARRRSRIITGIKWGAGVAATLVASTLGAVRTL